MHICIRAAGRKYWCKPLSCPAYCLGVKEDKRTPCWDPSSRSRKPNGRTRGGGGGATKKNSECARDLSLRVVTVRQSIMAPQIVLIVYRCQMCIVLCNTFQRSTVQSSLYRTFFYKRWMFLSMGWRKRHGRKVLLSPHRRFWLHPSPIRQCWQYQLA